VSLVAESRKLQFKDFSMGLSRGFFTYA